MTITKEGMYRKLRSILTNVEDLTMMIAQYGEDGGPVDPPLPITDREIDPISEYQTAFVQFALNPDYYVRVMRKLPGAENHMMSVLMLRAENADGSPKDGVVFHVGAPGWDGADTQSGWKEPGYVEFPITTNGQYNVGVIGYSLSDGLVSKSSDMVVNLDNTKDGPPGDDGQAQRHQSWEIIYRERY